jgi:hypothetical protein
MGINFGSLVSSAVSGLGSLATTALHELTPAISKEATKLFNTVVKDTFQGVNTLGQGLVSALPSPLQGLAGKLLGEGSKALQGLAISSGDKAIANFFGQGSTVNGVQVPNVIGTPSRNAGTTTSAISTAVQSYVGSSSAAATSGSGALMGNLGDMATALSTGNTANENKMLAGVEDPRQRAQLQIQFEMQHQQELVEFISNIMKMLHDTHAAITRNIT